MNVWGGPIHFRHRIGDIGNKGFWRHGPDGMIIRDRFVAGHNSCELRQHLDSVPPETPMQDIVDRCRVHADSDVRQANKPGPDQTFPTNMVSGLDRGMDDLRVAAVVFAEDITGVMLSTVAEVASLADLAEIVAADATSLADAAMVTMKVPISANAGATSLADAGILFPADPAGVVTVGVAPLAEAGPVTIVVVDLADAGIFFPADPAGVVTIGVAPMADAGPVTMVHVVVDLADAGILFLADPAGTVTVEVVCLADAEEQERSKVF